MSEPIDLALEEDLDALDPLRHFRNDDEQAIVPVQPPSVLNQTIQFCFPPLGHHNNQAVKPVVIQLAIDPSPGCGGIAWPAGEVGRLV